MGKALVRYCGRIEALGITQAPNHIPRYHADMDTSATPPDAPARPDAPLDRSEPRVTVDEAVVLYQLADVARPKRRIQKYCARGDLDCLKVENAFGEQYMITRSSIDVHISHLQQAQAAALGRAEARPAAPEGAADLRPVSEPSNVTPPADAPAPERAEARPEASQGSAPDDFQGRYLSHLEKENVFLREQNTVLLERVKETNIITAKLQSMLSPFLGLGTRRSSADVRREGDSVESQTDL